MRYIAGAGVLALLLIGGAVLLDRNSDDVSGVMPADAPAEVTAEPAGEAAPDAGVAAAAPVEITEWPVPWEETRPRDPYVDGQGRVWFVGQRGDYVAYLEPESGEFTRFDLDPGTGPHNQIVDENGVVWYAGNRAAHIGRLDPATGEITKFPMPDPEAVRDPHTLVFNSAGDIWFTAQGSNVVGKLDPNTGAIEIVQVPTPEARPYGIVIDSQDRPWIAMVGTNKILTVDPATMEPREYVLPFEDARPRRIALTSDDMVWYVDWERGSLGWLDPGTGEAREWPAPSGRESGPYATGTDQLDRLWFVETGPEPNQLVGFDPDTEEFFSITPIPSGGGAIRNMYFHEPTQTFWFGTDANTIGRAPVGAVAS